MEIILFYTILLTALTTRISSQTPSGCVDKLSASFCTKYKDYGYCIFDYLKINCQFTCGYCPTAPTTLGPTITLGPPGSCGTRKIQRPSVIAGDDAVKGDWPWQILLLRNGYPSCGGSLISDRWVLTAAHCIKSIYASSYTVRLAEHELNATDGTEVNMAVSKVVVHPAWNSNTLENDIALIKLDKSVAFNNYIQPICLPTQDAVIGSKDCYITGWGKITHPGFMHDYLQQAVMSPVNNTVCEELNRKTTSTSITAGMLCAGAGGTNQISGCHGDSGGPYVCHVTGGGWELQGVVSHGSPNCDATATYTVFVRVMHYKQWIRNEMRK